MRWSAISAPPSVSPSLSPPGPALTAPSPTSVPTAAGCLFWGHVHLPSPLSLRRHPEAFPSASVICVSPQMLPHPQRTPAGTFPCPGTSSARGAQRPSLGHPPHSLVPGPHSHPPVRPILWGRPFPQLCVQGLKVWLLPQPCSFSGAGESGSPMGPPTAAHPSPRHHPSGASQAFSTESTCS